MNGKNHFAEMLEPRLKPLYRQLISDVSNLSGPKDTFAAQWGQCFPTTKNEGILFVGRATNKWHNKEKKVDIDVDILFGDPSVDSTIFNCNDQMIWVEHCANANSDYNTRKSAFWRVIRSVSRNFYPQYELNHIAWTNVVKIQEHSGQNPSGPLFDCQIDTCKVIFKTELEVLSPKFVVMFTGGYGEREMLSFLNGGEMPKAVESVNWSDYNVDVYTIANMVFLCSEHPQGKDENLHIDCLIKLITKYNTSDTTKANK